jgi:succinylglutamate desuccinylase
MRDYNSEESKPSVTFHGPDGEPEVTVIGGIHGDEPAGVEVIRKLREDDIEYRRPVQLVIGNPSAVEECERYLETDLNRAYPGNETGVLEEQIASEIMDIINGTTVLSIHTTHSTDTPFAILDSSNERLTRIVDELSVPYAVDPTPMDGNALSRYGDVIELEAGRQYSDEAIKQAQQITEQYLQVMGVMNGSAESSIDTKYFEMFESVEKPDDSPDRSCDVLYNFEATNFEKVNRGEVYAQYQSNELQAESDFYPILMSQCGYEGIFGFKGRKISQD